MENPYAERLARLRVRLRELGLDYLVVRSTDRYLNEYVPAEDSTRQWLTGFTGSVGDALVGLDRAWLLADGRYHVQAARELDGALWEVVKMTPSVNHETACADTLRAAVGGRAVQVGYEPERYSVNALEAFQKALGSARVTLRALSPSPVEALREGPAPRAGALRAVDESRAGGPVADKVARVARWLGEQFCDALWVQKLDEVAWLSNLRGDELPYQATFRAEAVVTREAVLVAVHASPVDAALHQARPGVRFVSREGLFEALAGLGAEGPARVALDPASTSVATRDELVARGFTLVPGSSPVAGMKARKSPEELAVMKNAFARADAVVAAVQGWLADAVDRGLEVTEGALADEVERRFRAAGAVGLSFRVIAAAGVNAAVVHHPASEAVIRRGDLVLLDTGAYFSEGYATDLTRTFLAGGPSVVATDTQRRLFTLTLRAAIAGMTARIPKGATGAQLDGITRAPLWREGLDYAHGTGHGVGIAVHEAPPRIASIATTPVEAQQVFSIEPGVYQPGVGGVRIENLCTAVPDPEREDFLRVEPLTFSPLDGRLLDRSLLGPEELAFVSRFPVVGG
jgi:Xaa-Pro aminopeptidase